MQTAKGTYFFSQLIFFISDKKREKERKSPASYCASFILHAQGKKHRSRVHFYNQAEDYYTLSISQFYWPPTSPLFGDPECESELTLADSCRGHSAVRADFLLTECWWEEMPFLTFISSGRLSNTFVFLQLIVQLRLAECAFPSHLVRDN